MLRWFKGKKNCRPTGRRGSFFKPFLEVLEDRRLLSTGAILQGTVFNDQTHMPQSGAIVQLYQENSNGDFISTGQNVTTGVDGSYSFAGLTPGTYQLVETASGYVNDSTSFTPSPVESVVSSTNSSITVKIASQLSYDISIVGGSQLNILTPTGAQSASVEILSYEINGQLVSNDFVGQLIASANGETNGMENAPTFNTFCIDLSPNGVFDVGSNDFAIQPQTDLSGIGGDNVQVGHSGEIAYLYNTFGTGTLSNVDAAALQIAIWSLEYNANPSIFDSTTQTIPSGNYFYLTSPNLNYISQSTYNAVVAQAQTYLNDAAGQNGQALFLKPGTITLGGEQGLLAPLGSFNFSNVPQASPTITTTPNITSVTLADNSVTLKDTAVLSGGDNPTGTITFTLIAPNGTAVDTETVSVNGNGTYTTPTGYTLPTNAAVIGLYQWDARYSGDSNNSPASDNNDRNEQVTVSPASPTITTTPGGTVVLDSNDTLTDSATLSGGYNPTGTITFYLFAPGVTPNNDDSNAVYSEIVTVNGNGTYYTSTGFIPAVTGTFEWVAVYSGDSNNNLVASTFGDEPETVNAPSSSPVAAGEFATIGFWHNKNGQAVINSFNGGSTATDLGNWLATNFPNLFGTSNPYISKDLKQFGATSLAGLTNAQIAKIYADLWTPSGVAKNTYVQAFAVALGIYADTSSLSGTNTLASQYGFTVTSSGFGSATYNVGANGAAFGVANNTSLTVMQILEVADANFNAALGTFYNGNKLQQTLTSELNNVLNGINTQGDI